MRRIIPVFILSALLIAVLPTLARGQQVLQIPGKMSVWKGFKRFDFEFMGRNCRLVCPDKPAPGNPWIWNARFPDWHTEMDSILLSRGFFVTYINTDEFNGSPEGVQVWDKYYKFLSGELGLSGSVALEGISRGGLYVYNFAKKYPWRVSCIYAEAPVCDISSWPGGFGKGKGSPEDWQLVLKAYKFRSEAEARTSRCNPVDSLEALAAARVPVLHMIGLNDGIVPPDENTFVLTDTYVRLGGVATIVPCTRGIQELSGHHFDIETPALAADFVIRNTRAFITSLPFNSFHEYRGGLASSANAFSKTKKGRIAFLGGSITYNPGWRDSVSAYFRESFPGTTFEFISAGIPSLGSLPDAFRANNDIFSKGKIDLLFVEAAVNDRTNGYPGQVQVRSMEGIVRQAKKNNPDIDLVFMYFADPDKTGDYNKGIVPGEIVNHEKVAAFYNIPSVNLAREVAMRINNREFSWEGDFVDLHPSPFGQQVYYRSISALLDKCMRSEEAGKANKKSLPSELDPYCYDGGSLVEVSRENAADGWSYNPVWEPSDGAATRDGYTKVPMLEGTKPGMILRFRFKGTAVGIAVASGSDAGTIEYSIDGGSWMKMDLYTQWSNWLHLPWFLVLGDELKEASHLLRIRLAAPLNKEGKAAACRIRYFLVNRSQE